MLFPAGTDETNLFRSTFNGFVSEQSCTSGKKTGMVSGFGENGEECGAFQIRFSRVHPCPYREIYALTPPEST